MDNTNSNSTNSNSTKKSNEREPKNVKYFGKGSNKKQENNEGLLKNKHQKKWNKKQFDNDYQRSDYQRSDYQRNDYQRKSYFSNYNNYGGNNYQPYQPNQPNQSYQPNQFNQPYQPYQPYQPNQFNQPYQPNQFNQHYQPYQFNQHYQPNLPYQLNQNYPPNQPFQSNTNNDQSNQYIQNNKLDSNKPNSDKDDIDKKKSEQESEQSNIGRKPTIIPKPPNKILSRPHLNTDAKEFKSVIGMGSINKSAKSTKLGGFPQNGFLQNGFPQSGFITLDLTPENKSDKNNQNPLKDIFKALLGINHLEEEDEENVSKSKLKTKEYDITREDYKLFDKNIVTIDDLLELSTFYDEKNPELMEKYTVDLKQLVEMREPLTELKNMIGMDSVKKSIIRQVVYFLQGIEEQQDMLHMVITGSPGTGKTSLGMILSKLYYSMGLLDKKESVNPISGKKEDFIFKIYKRSDLVGQYLGHTAIKTQKAIDECIGGVMFLDEAYSLGGPDEKSDIYTKECLDTINQNLSENKKNFILIIAGYPDQLDKCFFSHNEGLKRRFAFRYHIDKYTSDELSQMLMLKIKQNKWTLDESVTKQVLIKMIDESKEMFENFGGDIESWLLHVKIEHGVRIFGKHPKYRRCINESDLVKGLEQFKTAKENKHQKEKLEHDRMMMRTLYC
jgi:Cdc6-like AAA superfamily ATPase